MRRGRWGEWKSRRNDKGLRRHRTLTGYLAYYHEWRTHLSLAKDAPRFRRMQPSAEGKVIEIREVGGLHHHYERRAA
jgi:putative transposase